MNSWDEFLLSGAGFLFLIIGIGLTLLLIFDGHWPNRAFRRLTVAIFICSLWAFYLAAMCHHAQHLK